MQVRAAGFALLTLLIPAALRADEIRLKDGTKITGAIVGYESDSFRVETSYGFALIRKDKVAEITISPKKKDSESRSSAPAGPAAPLASAPPSAARTDELVPAVAKEPIGTTGKTLESSAPSKGQAKSSSAAPGAAAKSDPAAAKNLAAATPTAPLSPAGAPMSASTTPDATPAPPPSPPEPPVIRDEIHGTEYANLTYGFHMYKPPSWDLIPEARKALPDAIAALGTFDQTTLLVIGREKTKDSLDAHAGATGKTLGGVYENYRLISNKHFTIAGYPAIEQRARGTAAGKDWSVVLVTFLKGDDAYTLLGMTWADSDLIQVQENVLTKSVNSLTFTTQ
jgi:hypothetical protein